MTQKCLSWRLGPISLKMNMSRQMASLSPIFCGHLAPSCIATFDHKEMRNLFSLCTCVLSRVQLFKTPWPVACQIPLPMEFSRQEYWCMLPFPTPGDLHDQGSNPHRLSLLHWQVGSFPLAPQLTQIVTQLPDKVCDKWCCQVLLLENWLLFIFRTCL